MKVVSGIQGILDWSRRLYSFLLCLAVVLRLLGFKPKYLDLGVEVRLWAKNYGSVTCCTNQDVYALQERTTQG